MPLFVPHPPCSPFLTMLASSSVSCSVAPFHDSLSYLERRFDFLHDEVKVLKTRLQQVETIVDDSIDEVSVTGEKQADKKAAAGKEKLAGWYKKPHAKPVKTADKKAAQKGDDKPVTKAGQKAAKKNVTKPVKKVAKKNRPRATELAATDDDTDEDDIMP